MKQENVPQEKNITLDGLKKVMYAIDENGSYTTVASDGWKVEEIVTSQAVEEFRRLTNNALMQAKDENSSVLEYHMYNNRMDLALLSQVTGFFKWTVKKDFKISTFNGMSDKRAQVYASVFGISLGELRTIPNS